MSGTRDFALSKLAELLDTISAMPSVPEFDPSNATASYEEWEKQFQALNDLEHDAEVIALCTVPADVAIMLSQVEAKVREKQRL